MTLENYAIYTYTSSVAPPSGREIKNVCIIWLLGIYMVITFETLTKTVFPLSLNFSGHLNHLPTYGDTWLTSSDLWTTSIELWPSSGDLRPISDYLWPPTMTFYLRRHSLQVTFGPTSGDLLATSGDHKPTSGDLWPTSGDLWPTSGCLDPLW